MALHGTVDVIAALHLHRVSPCSRDNVLQYLNQVSLLLAGEVSSGDLIPPHTCLYLYS